MSTEKNSIISLIVSSVKNRSKPGLAALLCVTTFRTLAHEKPARWSFGIPDAFSDVTGHVEVRLSLARALEKLPVVVVTFRQTQKTRVAMITRYDRVASECGFHRLHQEDFCQALGIGPAHKYEKESGPSLHHGDEILRRHSIDSWHLCYPHPKSKTIDTGDDARPKR